MSSSMEIDVSTIQGRVPVTLFKVTGSIDGGTYKNLEAQANDAYSSGTRDLLIDLSEVDYMGSAGFRALQSIHKTLSSGADATGDRSAHLKLLSPTEDVRRIFKTLGFDLMFDIYQDQDAAVAAF